MIGRRIGSKLECIHTLHLMMSLSSYLHASALEILLNALLAHAPADINLRAFIHTLEIYRHARDYICLRAYAKGSAIQYHML